MKQSQLFMPTMKEVPTGADVVSHQLLLRAGYIRQIAAGVYSYLPLAKRVLHKVETIVREELDKVGAVELTMPAIHPAELWQETGRWDLYGPEMMRLQDRHGRDFALGPTHEEVITSLLRSEINSYKKLPLTLYQIQTKYRDERRPRFGLLRGREFIMKDAYSFHASQEDVDAMYDKMYQAYSNIFTRCGIDFRPVIADSGEMGGKDTHEFMALADVGEDTIAYSDSSDYAANIEMAAVNTNYVKSNEELRELEKVNTGSAKTIEEVSELLAISKDRLIKSLLYIVDEEPMLILVRGDHELNEIKLKHELNASTVELASSEKTHELLQVEVGNVGPINIPSTIKVYADHAVAAVVNGVCGANESEMHFKNVNIERDVATVEYGDIRMIQEGDVSPDGKGIIKFARGIEVGQVFKLGTHYSEKMGASFLDENGKSKPMIMGCYGIGISRTVSAIIEQHNDENGIVWPKDVAPYAVHVIAVNVKNDEQRELSEAVYERLKGVSIEVLYDDRKERAGVKFADSDLIGMPIRVTVGKQANEGIVEVKLRHSGETFEVHESELVEKIQQLLK
ncbi:proline--tRNA ligase [Lottiidibacillus patelloidae]|uniref:Proline--tRNA ligase n=1 Tax=Lottiidibacillus patelloidae TaxID=2670334 RepID=A0A263BYC7_9BACI|nr:proline--tRNA ligase [Lottiidibacillus patelloidae]OZM58608.1 proline--tRNA ligase [Lottiidibacillus patelloidae]